MLHYPTFLPVAALAVVLFSMAMVTSAQLPDPPKPPLPESAAGPKPDQPVARPVVVIETSLGTIKAELWPDKAPATVKNFLDYAKDAYFDGLIFHRVISGFMIQGGGFSTAMQKKKTRAAIKNEARSDVPNARGTLAMARTMVVDSATAQFFINLVDNAFLNHRNKTPQGYGYCVFGKVTEGLDVVDKIGKVKTGVVRGMKDVPLEPVVIKSIKLAE